MRVPRVLVTLIADHWSLGFLVVFQNLQLKKKRRIIESRATQVSAAVKL